MKTRLFLLLLMLFLSPVLCLVYGQEIETEYKLQLMKAGLNDSEFQIVETDSLEYYFNSYPEEYYLYSKYKNYYINNFKLGKLNYFLIKSEFMPEDLELCDFKVIVEDFTSDSLYTNNFLYSFDKRRSFVVEPYMLEEPHILQLENGIWIMGGFYGNAFLSTNGSIYNFRPVFRVSSAHSDSTLGLILQDFIGKVGDKHLGVFALNYPLNASFHYYLTDLSSSPYIDSTTAKRVYFPDEYYVHQLYHMKDNIYLERNITKIRLLELKDSVFTILKEYQYNAFYKESGFRNNHLYMHEASSLVKYTYNPQNNDITGPQTLLNESEYDACKFDQDFKFAVLIKNDTIYIYDVDKEAITNRIHTPGVRSAIHPFIDSNYVYIHAVTEIITGEIKVVDESLEPLTYKLSAYPNPFNPQTTIAFTIANSGKVELAVYDLLGRKVTELLNDYRDKGSYEVKFNGANLASGIYFYTIKAGNFVKTQKLMLLK